ncbi:MAG: hypothetical protein V5A72_02770 [Candidatus Nanohaloarchaea archaeon]
MKPSKLVIVKAQSGIEYLITYGWMVIAIGVIGGGLYQYSDSGCNLEVSGLQGADLRAEDVAIDSDNQLNLAFRSSSNRQIRITEVTAGNGSLVQLNDLILEPGETRAYEFAETNSTEDCAEVELEVQYDIGPVNNQRFYGELRAPAKLVKAIVKYLAISGGEIDRLKVESTIKPSTGDICVGDQCSLTDTGDSEYVNRSGDEMTGYLEVRELEFNCFGDECSTETGTYPGYVSLSNNTMDGTLNVTEINPERDLCLGRCQ